MAAAPRAAIASWHLRVSKAPSVARQRFAKQTVSGDSDAGDFLIGWDLVGKFGQHPSPVRSNR